MKRLVIDRTQFPAAGSEGVVDVDHHGLGRELRQRRSDGRCEFGVGDQQLRAAVLQHEGDGFGVEPRVQRVEHAAAHQHAEMRLDHFRRVRRHQRDRVASADACPNERGSEPPRTRVCLGPGITTVAVHHGEVTRIRIGGARDQRKRRQRRVVRRIPPQILFEWIARCHGIPATWYPIPLKRQWRPHPVSAVTRIAHSIARRGVIRRAMVLSSPPPGRRRAAACPRRAYSLSSLPPPPHSAHRLCVSQWATASPKS